MTPTEVERRTLEQRLQAVNTAIDTALDQRDQAGFVRARGLRMQLLSKLAKTYDRSEV